MNYKDISYKGKITDIWIGGELRGNSLTVKLSKVTGEVNRLKWGEIRKGEIRNTR